MPLSRWTPFLRRLSVAESLCAKVEEVSLSMRASLTRLPTDDHDDEQGPTYINQDWPDCEIRLN